MAHKATPPTPHPHRTPIAIIGMGGIYPNGKTLEEFWNTIYHGKEAFQEINPDLWDPSMYYSPDPKEKYKTRSKIVAPITNFTFPYENYAVPPFLLKDFDPMFLYALEAARLAMDSLHQPLQDEVKFKTGVFMGCSGVTKAQELALYLHRHEFAHYLEDELLTLGIDPSLAADAKNDFITEFAKFGNWNPPALSIGNLAHVLSSLICHCFNLQGMNMVVDGACGSSFVALDVACHALHAGDIDAAIVGGADSNINPEVNIGFSLVNGLSNTYCHSFDDSANGIVLGQGAGVILIKRLEDAIRANDTIHAVIRGIGGAGDGGRKAIYAPDVDGIARSIHNALQEAQWTPEMVDYIEAHATGTRVGDATEYDALGKAYGQHRDPSKPVHLGAVKELIGHTKAASGIAGLIKTILCMEHKQFPAVFNYSTLNSLTTYEGKGLAISNQFQPWEADEKGTRRAGISANGFGGINYHVLIEQAPSYSSDPWEKMEPTPCAIVAYDCLAPQASTCDQAWDNMLNQTQVFRKVDPELFDTSIFGTSKENPEPEKTCAKYYGKIENFTFESLKYKIIPNLAMQMDKSHQYGIDLTDRLGIRERLHENDALRERTSIVVGSMINHRSITVPLLYRFSEYETIYHKLASINHLSSEAQQTLLQKIKERMIGWIPPSTEETMPGWMNNVLAGRIAKCFDIQGPNFIVDASSTSSMAALLIALYQLRSGQVDQVIAGGVNANVSVDVMVAMSTIGSLTDTDTSAFGSTGNGFILSEGGAMFLIKRLSDAQKDKDPIHGIITSIAGATEGHEMPFGKYQYKTTLETLKRSQENSLHSDNRMHFIDPHGSGYISDAIEAKAVHDCFQPASDHGKLNITSFKSHLGHGLGSAGAVSVACSLRAMKQHILPCVRNLKKVDPEFSAYADTLEIVRTNTTLTPSPTTDTIKCGILGLGIGGSYYFIQLMKGE